MLLACVGYLYIFFIVTLLVGTVGLTGYLVTHSGSLAVLVAKVGLKFGLPLLALLAITARALWVRLEPPDGIRVTPKDCPELFALLTRIRRQLKAPRTQVVLLNPEFNAGIVQIPRLGLLGWQKNYLLLGLPLMQALSPEQFTAVLGHEYGHLSGAHGKLGGWIYRIRMTWFQLMHALDQQDHWGRFVFRNFFDWYAPFFSAYSFVLARSNEYEADRCATELTGVPATAQALVNTDLGGAFLSDEFWPQTYRQADTLPEPPAGVYQAMSNALREPPAGNQNKWLAMALNVKTGLDDTHPSLSDRLAALGAHPELPPSTTTNAAEHFLGEALARFQQIFDDAWRRDIKTTWEERYQYVQSSREKLEDFKTRYDDGTLNAEQSWEYGQLLHDLEGGNSALPVYRKVFELDPTHSPARFLTGQLMLHNGDEGGIALIEETMERSLDFIMPGSQIVFEFLCEHGREQEARRYYEWAEQRSESIGQAMEERSRLPFDSEYRPAQLDEEERALLVAQIQPFPNIAHAYVARRDVQHLSEYPFYVVGVVLDPPVSSDRTEEELSNQIRFPHHVAFLALTGSKKPLLEILKAVPGSQLF